MNLPKMRPAVCPANGIVRFVFLAGTLVSFPAFSALVVAQDTGIQTDASWIWYPEDATTEGLNVPRYLRCIVSIESAPRQARLRVMSDDRHTLWVNGELIGDVISHDRGGTVYDIADALRPGRNVLAFEVVNLAGPGGIIFTGEIVEEGGRTIQICSGASCRASATGEEGWRALGFDDASWKPAAIVGSAFAAPWYHHSAFDMKPFLTDADRKRWAEWREPLLRLPDGLADEVPARADIDWVNGTCVLRINGQPRPAFLYRGTVDPMSLHGRRQIALFRDAGIHVYTAYLPLASCWISPDKYDFTLLDERIRGYLSVDPEAYMVLILRLVPPSWWMDSHRDELVRYATGSDFNTTDEAGRVCRPSLASEVWQRDAMAVWRAAIRHLESLPWGRRVIGYQPGYGIYTEWHYFGSWRHEMPDTSLPMTDTFRTWLRGKYPTNAALQKAWRQDRISFNSVFVPKAKERLVERPLGMLLPGQDRWVIDYYHCQQQITADVMESFCRAAKEETGGRVLAGAFYGYYFGVPPQTQGGHLELPRMLQSEWIDYFAAPYDYSHRLVGDDGRGRAVVDAFPLAGKAHMVEVDTRTHLHGRNEYGRVSTLEESLAVIRREVATTLLHGSAMWWCDFGTDGSGGWYDQPELIAEVAAMYRLAEDLLEVPRSRNAQIALVCDLESFYYMADGKAMRAQQVVLDDLCSKLKRLGAPVDMIFLDQLDQVDISRYRLLVFPHTLCMTEKQRETAKRAVTGRTALWQWAPGITDGRQFSPELVEDVTGMAVRLDGNGLTTANVVVRSDHPLTRSIPGKPMYEVAPQRSELVDAATSAANWYNPRDEQTMKDQYADFRWKVDDGALQWNFATTAGWTDIHLDAAIPQCDAIQLTLDGRIDDGQLTVSIVLKGSDGSEFASAPFAIETKPTLHLLPVAAFEKARWSRSDAPLTFPLRGVKIVVYGCSNNHAGKLYLRDLAAVYGETRRRDEKQYSTVAPDLPVLVIDDKFATSLGHCPQSGDVLLASKGPRPVRTLLATAPNVPLPFLRTLADEAGVHRYVDREDVLVEGDSALLVLHTKTGGPVTIHLPKPARLADVLTGAAVGEGTEIRIELEPVSTTILRRYEQDDK